jgi:hypothetical protein
MQVNFIERGLYEVSEKRAPVLLSSRYLLFLLQRRKRDEQFTYSPKEKER